MATVKHIHEVIFLVEQNNAQLSPEQLVDTIASTWGHDVHFGSCSGNAFPKEHALDFLLAKQKVILTDSGTIALHPAMQICNGHEEFSS